MDDIYKSDKGQSLNTVPQLYRLFCHRLDSVLFGEELEKLGLGRLLSVGESLPLTQARSRIYLAAVSLCPSGGHQNLRKVVVGFNVFFWDPRDRGQSVCGGGTCLDWLSTEI